MASPYHLHGHVHLYDRSQPYEQTFGDTKVINVFPYRLLELNMVPEISQRARSGRAVSRPFETEVRADFERARQRGFLADLRALFARRPRNLIPYHELRERVSPETESYRGLQTVPLANIVGSMDRFDDFNREFFPRQRFTAGRWQNVDRAYYQDVQLPPIQLYKVGDVYFVKDGNHRVSVARDRGTGIHRR